MENEKPKAKIVNLPTREVEVDPFDCDKYIGKRALINVIEMREGGIFDGIQSYYYIAKTEAIDIINDKEVTANKMFSLITKKDGTIGWTPNSPLAAILKKYKVTTPEQLIGKEVIIQKEYSKKHQKDFLTF